MIFAEYYEVSPVRGIKPKVGMDSVCVLDGRNTRENQIVIAKTVALSKNERLNTGIVGFYLCQGKTFTRATKISNTFHKV